MFITILAVWGVRNTYLEELHAGCSEESSISDADMRFLMLDVEDKIGMVIDRIESNEGFPYATRTWDLPQEQYDEMMGFSAAEE
jgi:hypothetical protein